MYVHIVSHLPTSFASDVISAASVLYVLKFHTGLLYWSSVLHLSAAFHSGTVLCVVKIFLLPASYRSYNPWRRVVMCLPVSVALELFLPFASWKPFDPNCSSVLTGICCLPWSPRRLLTCICCLRCYQPVFLRMSFASCTGDRLFSYRVYCQM